MLRLIGAFLCGIGAALLVGSLFGRRGGHATYTVLNLNQCTADELLGISGLDADLVDRILDNRPYRNPLDLVTCMVIPTRIYAEIKHRVHVPKRSGRSRSAGRLITSVS